MKRAFTIAEFIISIATMFIIMGCAVSIPMKKAKQTTQIQKQRDTIVCSCADQKTIRNGYECEVTIEKHSGRHEFYSVQLLGGGAAGGPEKGGSAGEAKIIHYPTLEGEFLIKLGAGGQYGGNINGGSTAIYKLTEEGKYELLEFARGGLGANEKIDVASEISETDATLVQNARNEMKKGEIPSFGSNDTVASRCGIGGDAGGNGQYGEVIIKW